MNVPDILQRIVASRRERIAQTGAAQGITLPRERTLPIVPFPGPVICEIKRKSPSRGLLAAEIDPVEQAGRYQSAGATSVSVLTEEEHFCGSLADLIAVKEAYPDLAVLRKDFLLSREDVEISYRAGADAVLLIAGILPTDRLREMYETAQRLGLAALVEVHDLDELAAVRPCRPRLIGINSRDLRTFRVDLLHPLTVAQAIDWECTRVFESGIFHREEVYLAKDGGFGAILVGEAVVKDPGRVSLLRSAMVACQIQTPDSTPGRSNRPAPPAPPTGTGSQDLPATSLSNGRPFWSAIAHERDLRGNDEHRMRTYRPLVKICGITTVEDARCALENGADLLGMIYAQSPRTAPVGLARALRDAGIHAPLVGVVVEGDPRHAELLARAQEDLHAGALSALQLHGTSAPEGALSYGWPVYKAVTFRSVEEVRRTLPTIRTPRVLIDAYHPTVAGGTGTAVEGEVLDTVVETLTELPHGALWLAGGLNPDTVYRAVVERRPELVDASSGLESEPGKKSPELIRRFFEAIDEGVNSIEIEKKMEMERSGDE